MDYQMYLAHVSFFTSSPINPFSTNPSRGVSDLLLLIHVANELRMTIRDLLQIRLEEGHAFQQTPGTTMGRG
jgi:hypothetical protein